MLDELKSSNENFNEKINKNIWPIDDKINLDIINKKKIISLIGPKYKCYTPDSWIYEIIKILFYEFESDFNLFIPNHDFMTPLIKYENFQEYNKIENIYSYNDQIISQNNHQLNNLFYITSNDSDFESDSFIDLYYKLGLFKNKYVYVNPDINEFDTLNKIIKNDSNTKFSSTCLLDVCRESCKVIDN
jgi:hypothetical protein